MSNYNQVTIIEANFKDRINPDSNSNDFTVRTPPRVIKKGSQVELSGAIIQEKSANNDTVIELSNFNVSDDEKYTSSWCSISTRYFINHTGYNNICFPFIQTNYSNLSTFSDVNNVLLWEGQESWPNNTIYIQPYETPSLRINLISGFTANPIMRQDYLFSSNSYNLKSTVDFIKFDSTIENAGSVFKGNWVIPDPFDMYDELGTGNNTMNFALQGACGIRCGLKKNKPNSKKHTYIKPNYKGPCAIDNSESTNIKDMEIFLKHISIDLKDNLMETADELALLINTNLQGDKFNLVDNDVKVTSKFRQWSTDYLQQTTNNDMLYPPNSDKVITSITSNTLFNIPANFQHTGEHAIFSESFFVEDPNKWIYGNNFFKSNNKLTKINDGTFIKVDGIDPVVMRQDVPNFDSIWRLAYNGSTVHAKDYPCLMAMSMKINDPIYYPVLFDSGALHNPVEWVFLNSTPNIFPDNGFLRFKQHNIDGTSVNETLEFIYALDWSYNGNTEHEYFICSHDDDNGNLCLIGYPAEIQNLKFVKTSNQIQFKIILEASKTYNKDTIELIFNNQLYHIQNQELDQITHVPLNFIPDTTYNGMPYYNMVGTDGGGQYCTEGQDLGNATVNEFLCIPDKMVIPLNIKVYNDVNDLSIVLDRVRDYLRANEKYIGSETDPVLIEKDSLNWIMELDVGMADDFNNSLSNFLSSKGLSHEGFDDTDYTIYDEQQNYSIYPKYFPNMMSYEQYDIKANTQTGAPFHNGFNFRRPLTIYPISRYCRMGCGIYTNTENYLQVYSRYNKDILNITSSNSEMNVDFNTVRYKKRLHPSISINNNDNIINAYCEYNNIPLVACNYIGSDYTSFGFINYKDTFGGNGQDKNTYSDLTGNFRNCFRLVGGVNIGFDPSSSTNPYSCAMNRQQSVPTNGNFYCSEFYGGQNNTTENLETGLYTYGTPTNPIFSPRIEDYINFIYIGGSPEIDYDRSRMIFNKMYQPRKYDSNDALVGDPNIGSEIAMINDKTMFYSVLNCTIGTVPANGPNGNNGPSPSVGQVSTRGQPAFFQKISNSGIVDSLSGVGFENIYVRDELSKNELPGEDGVKLCTIDINNNTTNYNKSLLNLLGFSLRQFKPFYGQPFNRYSRHNYNATNNLKYDGLSYFSLNSFINQTNMQNICMFGPNYNITDPSPLPLNYYPQSLRGQPQLLNGYVGFNNQNIQVKSDQLRSEDIPSKLQQSFFKIVSSLPSNDYITSNNNMPCIGYFYRNYKNSNYYFTYNSGNTFTLSQDILLTSIRTSILGENNKNAEHLGQSMVAFYKITEQRQLTSLNEEDIEELQEIEKNPQNSGLQMNSNLSDTQIKEINSINNQLLLNVSMNVENVMENENVMGSEIIINENPEILKNFKNENISSSFITDIIKSEKPKDKRKKNLRTLKEARKDINFEALQDPKTGWRTTYSAQDRREILTAKITDILKTDAIPVGSARYEIVKNFEENFDVTTASNEFFTDIEKEGGTKLLTEQIFRARSIEEKSDPGRQ